MTNNSKNRSFQSSPNIYEYLDPLSSSEIEYDDTQTSEAIRCMMVDQKRDFNQRVFLELVPLETPEVTERDTSEITKDDSEPAAQRVSYPKQEKPSDRVFRWLGYSWWLLPLLCGLLFPKIVLTAAILAVIMTLLLMALFGPEAILDSVARGWRPHNWFGKMTSQGPLSVKERALSLSKAIKTGLAEWILKTTKRAGAD